MATNEAVGSPRWWIQRLDKELAERTPEMDLYRQLSDDIHMYPESAETSQKFIRMARLSTTNLIGLAVEATAERIEVEGIRIGDDPDSDKSTWDNIWQRSDFDAGSQEAITAAVMYGRSFISVTPPDGKNENAELNYEDPRQVVLAQSPDGESLAALKIFTDEWTAKTFGTLYLPDAIFKLELTGKANAQTRNWILRDMGTNVDAAIRNPFGEVPFFELQNLPLGQVRSEVAPLVMPQRLLNQTMFNIQAVAEFGAFRQKWATGIEVPRDPVTNKPIAPFEAHIAKLFVSEGEAAKFGDFGSTDLAPYIELAREIASHMARVSRLPSTYFMTEVSNVSADALALLVSGLVKKCGRRVKGYEPAFEGAIRLALKSMKDPRCDMANIEVKWADMETRSSSQMADAAVKLASGPNPIITAKTAQEKFLGMSQTERDRDEAWRQEGMASQNLEQLVAAVAKTTPTGAQMAGGSAEPYVAPTNDSMSRQGNMMAQPA